MGISENNELIFPANLLISFDGQHHDSRTNTIIIVIIFLHMKNDVHIPTYIVSILFQLGLQLVKYLESTQIK